MQSVDLLGHLFMSKKQKQQNMIRNETLHVNEFDILLLCVRTTEMIQQKVIYSMLV